MSDDLIRLEDITLRVGGRWILPNTSWTIGRGQNWVVLGPNGSGKTSLTAALTGEVPVVAGRRWLNPDGIREQDMARLAFETHRQLIARDEARDETRGFAGIDDPGMSAHVLLKATGSRPDTLAAVADRLELTSLLNQPLRSLSTGEMRRLLMARALLHRPHLLILDEPFNGLDASMRQHLADMITGLAREGLQVILVSHRQEEILPVMTHYLELGANRILDKGKFSGTSLHGYRKAKRKQTDTTDLEKTSNRSKSDQPDGDTPIIRMVNASVAYRHRRVLDSVNWCVYRGENWLVSGPNGAGKSTLLRLISADHLQGYANDIFLFGRKRGTGESIWEIKQRIGLVSNEFQVRYRKSLSGYEVILSGFFDSVGLFRLAGKTQRKQARDWVTRLQIEHLAEIPFDRMSSGQQRMVLIARAVVKEPELLILDEPCQGLDASNRERVLAMIAHIGAATPTNLIVTTHHADERPTCMTHELRLTKGGDWNCRRLFND
jgi:molybdate transport system ATP-binding protein